MFPRNRRELPNKKRKQLMREIEEKIGKLEKGEITSVIGHKSEQYYLGKEGKITTAAEELSNLERALNELLSEMETVLQEMK